MSNNRNLINSFSERIKSGFSGRSGKTVQIASYAALFVFVCGLVVTSYSTSSNAQVNLPGAAAGDNIRVSVLQGQAADGSSGVAYGSGVATAATKATDSSSQQSKSASDSGNGNTAQTRATTASDVKSANVASTVASVANLSSSSTVSSSAESANVTVQLAQADATSVNKQQITEPTTTSKSVVAYTAKDGDNVQAIAQKYGVSDQTVRWANNLTSDAVAPGTNLTVPTVDGVIYTMKDGDTLQSVASKYQSNVDSIMTMNNLNSQQVAVGTTLLLPDANLPENERPGYVEPTRTTARTTVTSTSTRSAATNLTVPTAGSNRYAFGYCTYYAFNRRVQLGLPVANLWGNANTWDTSAARAGYLVNTIPSVGAIFQTDSGPYGHVGIVERVNSDGSVFVSEMNYSGWNKITTRTITNLRGYKFIH